MAGTGRLQADPLFQGLARPPMVMGVSYLFFVLNAVLCLVVFIQSDGNFVMLLMVAPAIHGVGYMLCLKEPRAIELWMLHMRKGMRCINKGFHGNTNSYDIF